MDIYEELMSAGEANDWPQFQNVLRMHNAGINTHIHDRRGYTALCVAVAAQSVGVVKELLSFPDLNVNAHSKWDGTPLHIACDSGNLEIVRALLLRRAQVHARDNFEQTPLHVASREGHAAIVRLLLRMGADPLSASGSGFLPMHYACWKGHLEVTRELLIHNNGSDNNLLATKNEYDKTPLDLAQSRGHTAVIDFLVKRNAFDSTVNSSPPRLGTLLG